MLEAMSAKAFVHLRKWLKAHGKKGAQTLRKRIAEGHWQFCFHLFTADEMSLVLETEGYNPCSATATTAVG